MLVPEKQRQRGETDTDRKTENLGVGDMFYFELPSSLAQFIICCGFFFSGHLQCSVSPLLGPGEVQACEPVALLRSLAVVIQTAHLPFR